MSTLTLKNNYKLNNILSHFKGDGGGLEICLLLHTLIYMCACTHKNRGPSVEEQEYCTQDPSELFQSCFVDTFFFKRAHTLFQPDRQLDWC